jgi:N-acyl-D-aspartate/D-glutamate deacylase
MKDNPIDIINPITEEIDKEIIDTDIELNKMKKLKVKTIDVGSMSLKEAEETINKITGQKKKNKFLEFMAWFFAFWS